MAQQAQARSIGSMLNETERLIASVKAHLGIGTQAQPGLAARTAGAPTPTTTSSRRRRRRRGGDLTSWTLNRQARRLPTFVMEMTGAKGVKELQTKYALGTKFEKGKPAPAQMSPAQAAKAAAAATPVAKKNAGRHAPTQAEARA